MKKKIFKYQMEVVDVQSVGMPVGAVVLAVQFQRGNLCLWAEVDPEAKTERVMFEVFGTGHVLDQNWLRRHVGTTQQFDGSLVWHVYRRTGVAS